MNLTIDQGELAAMVSPPGSGKTTQVHLMATLDRPSPGAVRLDGHLCQVNRTGGALLISGRAQAVAAVRLHTQHNRAA